MWETGVLDSLVSFILYKSVLPSKFRSLIGQGFSVMKTMKL